MCRKIIRVKKQKNTVVRQHYIVSVKKHNVFIVNL